jgi:hypothetical protein
MGRANLFADQPIASGYGMAGLCRRGAHLKREERPVIPRGLGAQPALDRRAQPTVEVFVENRARFRARRDLGEETGAPATERAPCTVLLR